ncbi:MULTISPECIES: hypothetical protein [unclassified Corynebacterium]|uniref:hypothetical protein n=1 Tax=unclassified Corynebacterium TaxID=2624378 RepID=UPI001EF6DA47|nr:MULTISPECIES: hypothetical protein [unclassified Corynebacterium]MCG7258518.1 hypothetical protein [Corynebacterium sp. ACRQK]MCG7263063.1 hypothetical protein [Corynebacterium sp. ACRQL]
MAQSAGESAAQATIASLRRKMQQIESGGAPMASASSAAVLESAPAGKGASQRKEAQRRDSVRVAPVPAWLAEHLPGGGVARGQATQISDCPAVLVDVLAHLTAQGMCVAVVDYPRLAIAAVAAAGGNVERLVLVPDSTPHTAAVLGTLVEGMDVVLFAAGGQLGKQGGQSGQSGRSSGGSVSPTFARPVEARLWKSECALLVCGKAWPQARMHVELQVCGVLGLRRGSGRIRAVEVAGRVWGKAQPPSAVRATIGAEDVIGAESVADTADTAGTEDTAHAYSG